MSWPEAMAIFTQGKAAFYTEADSLYKNATDPAKSKVADTVGFAALPAGPAGSKPYNIPSWGLAVNQASEQPGQRLEVHPVGHEQGTHPGRSRRPASPDARASVWANPEGTSTYPKDLAEAIAASAENGVGPRPSRGRHGGQGPRNRRRADRRHHHRRGRRRRGRHGPRRLPEVPGHETK